MRLEQVAPFPYDLVTAALERFPNAELVWVQEEPINAGAWAYVQPRIDLAAAKAAGARWVAHDESSLGVASSAEARRVRYVGRPPSAAPATGLRELHEAELEDLLAKAINLTNG